MAMKSSARWTPLGVLVIAVLLVGAPRALGQPRETTGLITEIKVGKGAVEVKPVGGRWRAAGPLQAVRAGDEIRTTENAAIVVVLTSGRGVVRIDARNSPWAAPAVSEIGKVTKAEALVSSGLSYLIGTAQDAPDVLLSTRAGGGRRGSSPRATDPCSARLSCSSGRGAMSRVPRCA
jgi:hypothetical protein